MTQNEALEKIKKYCAYQERCQTEVRTKLLEFKLTVENIENIICCLIEEDFINEERFSRSFVRGKFRQKKWGKIKIRQSLQYKNISEYCIRKGFEEIDEEEYLKTLESILKKKEGLLNEENEFIRQQKLAKYAISRGFENNLVWNHLTT
ncbi:MAG: RecX family transcriptional regulator [Flavobacteriales bacterium]|mgnify:FL=1|nr:RecX family transcriptional regulator [Flavobacteriales bacterium]|tara:strand:+ start:441 stop:887 length:447 start_codon:yes stop_codon:yes gene_type:complete